MAGLAGWQGWRPQLLHGPGRGRCAASRVRSVRSRRVGSGSGVRSARPLEPPALQSGRSRCSHRAGGAGSLSLAMPGAVRAIAQTRVSHHSEPGPTGSIPFTGRARRKAQVNARCPARPQALPGTEAGARGRRAELVGGSGSLGGDRLSTRPRR